MTICVGFRCVDGIMLCADTQETFSGYLKLKQPKIEIKGAIFPMNQSPCAVFAGAGNDGDLIDVLADKLWCAMEPKGVEGLDAMIEAAENELTFQYQRLIPLYPSGVPETEFLVGVWAALNEFNLIKIRGPLLKRNVILDAIGCGDILATYLTMRLLYPKSWIGQATPVGIYIIDQVKEHVEGCGGNTQLVTIDYKGEVEVSPHKEVKDETERLRSADLIARQIIGLIMNTFDSAENFARLLEETCKPLYKLAQIKKSPDQADSAESKD